MKIFKLLILSLFLFFQIVSITYADDTGDYRWIKVDNVDALLNFDAEFTKSNQFIWYGNTVNDEKNVTVINGTGCLILKDKKTGYQTGCVPCEFNKGILISQFQIPSTWYRCLNDSCTEIETTLSDGKKFRGHVTFDNNKLNIITYDEGIIFQKNQIYYKGEFKLDHHKIFPEGYCKVCYGKSQKNLDFLELAENDETPLPLCYQDGAWENGKFISGNVRIFLKDGGYYEGGFANDLPQSWGKYYLPNGISYFGEFLDGKRHGFGTYVYKDGSVYNGTWKNNQKNGYGELNIISKQIFYRGEFLNGAIEGKGVVLFEDGMQYIGGFSNNAPDGKGVLIDKSGNSFNSTFHKGKLINLRPIQTHDNNKTVFSFFVSTAYASPFDLLKKAKKSLKKSLINNFQKLKKWAVENKEHILNAGKG